MKAYYESNYEKEIIGRLIKYYRKKKNITVNEMLTKKGMYYQEYCRECSKCKNKEYACSTKKLYSLERGEVSNNDCYYYRLAENVGKMFVIDRRVTNKLENYRANLRNNLINFSKSKLTKLAIMISNDLSEYKNVIYFGEILSLYFDIINYNLYHTISCSDNIQLFAYMLPYMSTEDRKLTLCYLYEIGYRVSNNLICRKTINDYCKEYIDDALLFKYNLEQIVSQNFLDAYAILGEMEKRLANKITDFQLCCLLEYKAYILTNAESYEKSYNTIKECISVAVNNKDFSDYLISNYYGKLGVICFLLEKYSETIDAFNLLLSKNSSLGINYSLLFYSMKECGRESEIKAILDTIDHTKKRRPFVEKIINYYSMRYTEKLFGKKDYILLENMICEDIKPYLNNHGSIQKTIFTKELKYLVEKTGNYKKYYTFLEN